MKKELIKPAVQPLNLINVYEVIVASQGLPGVQACHKDFVPNCGLAINHGLKRTLSTVVGLFPNR